MTDRAPFALIFVWFLFAVRLQRSADFRYLFVREMFDADERAARFQPFFRGELGPSLEGLGLGLHIASEIAKAHGGELMVASDETETRFTFRMPLI